MVLRRNTEGFELFVWQMEWLFEAVNSPHLNEFHNLDFVCVLVLFSMASDWLAVMDNAPVVRILSISAFTLLSGLVIVKVGPL
jgi:hypothetical protein